MATVGRTYWLTQPVRIRREAQSLVVERPDGSRVHVPVTDVTDLVCFDHVDVNSSAVSLLSRHGVTCHLLDYYGNYAGAVVGAADQTSARALRAQVHLTDDPVRRLDVARRVVVAAAHNVRWALDTDLLEHPLGVLRMAAGDADGTGTLMAAEGNYRRTAWAVLDTLLPAWLRLSGRTRRPPRNAGNAFVSYANAIVYAQVLNALRATPLSPAIGFLHSDSDRRRNTLALDVAELFKPMFAERLLRRSAAQKTLTPADFEQDLAAATLSTQGRKKVAGLIRDELDATVAHKRLRRRVSYRELLHLEALKILRLCLEDEPYTPFRPWW